MYLYKQINSKINLYSVYTKCKLKGRIKYYWNKVGLLTKLGQENGNYITVKMGHKK